MAEATKKVEKKPKGTPPLKIPDIADLSGILYFQSSFIREPKRRELALTFLQHILHYDTELAPENLFKSLPTLRSPGIVDALSKLRDKPELWDGVYTVFPGKSVAKDMPRSFERGCLGTALNAPQIRPFFRSVPSVLYFQRIFDNAARVFPTHLISDSSGNLRGFLGSLPPNLAGKGALVCDIDRQEILFPNQVDIINSSKMGNLTHEKLERISLHQFYVDTSVVVGALKSPQMEEYILNSGGIPGSEQEMVWQKYGTERTCAYANYVEYLEKMSTLILKGRGGAYPFTASVGQGKNKEDIMEDVASYLRKVGCPPSKIMSLEQWVIDKLTQFGSGGVEYLDRIYDIFNLALAHGLFVFSDTSSLDSIIKEEIADSASVRNDLGKNLFISFDNLYIYGSSRAKTPSESEEWSKKTKILDHRFHCLLQLLRGSDFQGKNEDWKSIIDKTPREIISMLSGKGDKVIMWYYCGTKRKYCSTFLKKGTTAPDTIPCPLCGGTAKYSSSGDVSSVLVPEGEKGRPFAWVMLDPMKRSEFYPDAFYRYLINYIGGRLYFLRKYFLGKGDLDDFGLLTHPLDLWCLLLEIQYLLGFFTLETSSIVNREVSGVIACITTALLGSDEIEKIIHEVEFLLSSPDWDKERSKITQASKSPRTIVDKMRKAINANDWEKFIGFLTIYFRNRERGKMEREESTIKEEEDGEEKTEQEEPDEEGVEDESYTDTAGGKKSFYSTLIELPRVKEFLSLRFPVMLKVAHFLRTHLIPVPRHIPDFAPLSEIREENGQQIIVPKGLSRYVRVSSGKRIGYMTGGKFHVRPKFNRDLCQELEVACFVPEPYGFFINTEGGQKRPIVFQCSNAHNTTRYLAAKAVHSAAPIKCPVCGKKALPLRVDTNFPPLESIQIRKDSVDYLEVKGDDGKVLFAGNRWIYYAAMSVADRRIRNYVYNCGIEAASNQYTGLRGQTERKGKTVNLLAETWKSRDMLIKDQRKRNLEIDNAIMNLLKTSPPDFIRWVWSKAISEDTIDAIAKKMPRVMRFSIEQRAKTLRNRFDKGLDLDKYVLGKGFNSLQLRDCMNKVHEGRRPFTNEWDFAWWNDMLLCTRSPQLAQFVGQIYASWNLIDAEGNPDLELGESLFAQMVESTPSDAVAAIEDAVKKYVNLSGWYDLAHPKEGGGIALLESLCKGFALLYEEELRRLKKQREPDEEVVNALIIRIIKYLKLVYALEYLKKPESIVPDLGGFSFVLGQPAFVPSARYFKVMGAVIAESIYQEDTWKFIKDTYRADEITRGYENFSNRHTGYTEVMGDIITSISILILCGIVPRSQEITGFQDKIFDLWNKRIAMEAPGDVSLNDTFKLLFDIVFQKINVPPLPVRKAVKLGAISSSPTQPVLGNVDFSRTVINSIASSEAKSIPFTITVPPLLNKIRDVWDTTGQRVRADERLLISTYDAQFKPERNPLKPEVLFRLPGPAPALRTIDRALKELSTQRGRKIKNLEHEITKRTKVLESTQANKSKAERFVENINTLQNHLKLISKFAKSRNSKTFLDSVRSGLSVSDFNEQLLYWLKKNSAGSFYQFHLLPFETSALKDVFEKLAGLVNKEEDVLFELKKRYRKLIEGERNELKKAFENILKTPVVTGRPLEYYEDWASTFVEKCTSEISVQKGALLESYRKYRFLRRDQKRLKKMEASDEWKQKHTPFRERRSITRGLFNAALEYLQVEDNNPLYHQYIFGSTMTNEIHLDTNIINKIQAGASIQNIQFLPHNKGKRHVIANVALRGAPLLPLKFALKLLPQRAGLLKDSTLGVDVNRIGCLRPLAFSIVQREEKGNRPELFDLEAKSIDTNELAMLAQVYNFQDGSSHHFSGRVRGKPNTYENKQVALSFLETVSTSILRDGGKPSIEAFFKVNAPNSRLYRPSERNPYSLNPPFVMPNAIPWASTFNDQMWAIPYYWTNLGDHVRDHILSCTRRKVLLVKNTLSPKKKGQKDPVSVDINVPDEDVMRVKQILGKKQTLGGKQISRKKLQELGRILRLERQILYLENRGINLHTAAIKYLFRATLYMVSVFPVTRIAYEKTIFSSEGLRGSLALAVRGMLKNFGDIRAWVVRQLKLREEPIRIPEFVQVPAAMTSRYCHQHRIGIIDNALSPDYCPCSDGSEIVDRHVNAAGNIAYRSYQDRRFTELEKKYGNLISAFDLLNFRVWQEDLQKEND